MLDLGITLVGSAAREMAAVRAGFKRLELRGTALSLRSLFASPPDGGESVDAARRPAMRPWPIEVPGVPPAVRVVLQQPLRLQRRGRLVGPDELDVPALATALMRRVSALSEIAAGQPIHADFAGIKAACSHDVSMRDAALRWFDDTRYSGRQGQRIPVGGLLGAFTLVGGLAPLWPWLWVGQWTHMGKGAVMGLGGYRLESLAV